MVHWTLFSRDGWTPHERTRVAECGYLAGLVVRPPRFSRGRDWQVRIAVVDRLGLWVSAEGGSLSFVGGEVVPVRRDTGAGAVQGEVQLV